jgi:DNA-binding response OmpR family regulator
MPTLLLADDDEALCQLLSEYLELDGYTCDCVHRGDAVAAQLQDKHYDLLILDIMLPGLQGLDVLKQLRQTGTNLPIIMLTARGDDMDRILGLELGADDYLPKPCNPRELSARIRAVLRRGSTPPGDEQAPRTFGPFSLDPKRRRLSCQGDDIKLTPREFDLLSALLQKPNEVLSKETLSERVLQRPLEAFDRSLDMHVSHLRKKLADYRQEEYITTIRGIGYCLNSHGDKQ